MDNYIKILINEHSNFINDIVNTFFDKNNFIQQYFTYFRIYFFYYLVTTFVYKPEINISEIKKIFFIWIEKTLVNKNKNYILKNFNFHFNYLFKVFFIDKNIYFHVYFNNLIKYFLPLPFELNIYSPIVVFRNNVNKFYKKNNIDYLDNINIFDEKKIFFKNMPNEIDIHIPIKYFNENNFMFDNIIYLVGTKNKLYITDVKKNILYSRINNFNEKAKENLKKFNEGVVFEELFPIWEKENGKLNFDDAFYICIMKKITSTDLFKVFQPYNLNIKKYKYLFHNTMMNEEEINSNMIMSRETFFYIIPSSKSKYFPQEEKRNCIVFKIKKDINYLLDLTSSIATNNNFTKYMIVKDKNKKVWVSYDPIDVLNYYKKGTVATKFDENFKCLTIKKGNLDNRKYCDAYDYSGRRKLQEILFKTRKYKYKSIYISKIKKDILESSSKMAEYDIYSLYHPKNIPINITWDFDKFILKELNINGFFYVDYGDAIDGGEVLLINPGKYLEIYQKKEKTCYEI